MFRFGIYKIYQIVNTILKILCTLYIKKITNTKTILFTRGLRSQIPSSHILDPKGNLC